MYEVIRVDSQHPNRGDDNSSPQASVKIAVNLSAAAALIARPRPAENLFVNILSSGYTECFGVQDVRLDQDPGGRS